MRSVVLQLKVMMQAPGKSKVSIGVHHLNVLRLMTGDKGDS